MCKETSKGVTTTQILTGSRSVAFRYGKLQFGFHGLMGITCLALTSISIYYPYMLWTFILPSQICNLLLVNDARYLLHQVPTSTQIFPGVVAPHKEAFQRTIWVMQYLIARVTMKFIQLQLQQSNITNHQFFIVESIVILWRYYPLIPQLSVDWWNGNTWIFVIPIFIGVSGDLYFYFMYGDIFQIYQFLLGELLGLALAFGFTLGFRNYIPMPLVYCGAALAVWAIIQQGVATINAGAL